MIPLNFDSSNSSRISCNGYDVSRDTHVTSTHSCVSPRELTFMAMVTLVGLW